jgi:hypothetical protein
MATAEERFRRACNELGWGDAPSGLWFMGIEEASGWSLDQEEYVDHFYNHDAYFRDASVEAATGLSDVSPPENRSQIDLVEAKIAAPLSKSGPDAALFRRTIWHKGSGVAHANLYPLGKRKASELLPADYAHLFGFGATAEEKNRYVAEVKRLRFPRLREARNVLKPQAIVCMGRGQGQGNWADFREAFTLREENADRGGNSSLQVFSGERIILAPHWAYSHVPDVLAAKITAQLKEWHVSLP